MSTEKKIYTAADFSRYYSGVMPAGEMHALEKAALTDPFLGEALDGYVHSKDAITESTEIHQRIEERVAGKKSSKPKMLWLKIAAMFIVMAGLGYYVYLENDQPETKQFAQNEKVILPVDSGIISPLAQAPSSGIVTKDAPTLPTKPSPAIAPQEETAKMADKSLAYSSDEVSMEDKAPAAEQARSFKTDTLGGMVSSVVVRKEADGYSSSGKIIKDNQAEAAIAQDQKASKNMELDKAKKAAKSETAPVPMSAPVIQNNAVPIGGIEAYQKYLQQKILPVYEDSGNKITGKVNLQFYLDAIGTPKNITVKKSLCSSCDQQAIQLLSKGAKWSGRENTPYTLDVNF